MNTSNQTYKELAIPYFKEVFDCIDEIMIRHQIPYYLIGVNAIALEMLKEGVKPGRGTKDIDFAIMISSMNEYDELTKSLEDKGFHKVEAPWTFYSEQYNVAIDLLPFGEIEEKDTIRFSQRNIDLHVLGFKEVLADTVPVGIEEKITNIPPLPGMVILKLVAWSDRPEERADDLPDILKIIEHYFEIAYDEIVEFHNDLFPEEEGMDLILIAAEVLGRECSKYLDRSEELSKRIRAVLQSNLDEVAESTIAKIWARQKGWEVAYAFSILKAFEKGLLIK
jgi:predicted nucleotidyltransferase